MDISVRGFPLCHLEGGDAEAPDVGHAVVADLLNHLGGHPERGFYHSVSFGHGVCKLTRHSKVSQLSVTFHIE